MSTPTVNTGLRRCDPMAAQRDEPKQNNAADHLLVHVVVAPAIVGCRSDAGDMPVSNPNYLPQGQPQSKGLESEKTDGDGDHARSHQGSDSLVR